MKITPEIRSRIDSGEIRLGRVEGEPIDRYHATPALSNSKLKAARKSLRYFYRRYIEGSLPPWKQSEAMVLGQAVHAICESMESFHSQFIVTPEGVDRRTTAGKAAWAEFEARAVGRTILKAEVAHDAMEMAKAIERHPAASALLSGCVRETTWRTDIAGLLLQCRTDAFGENRVEVPFPDGVRVVGPRVVDIKKTASLDGGDFNSFQNQFFKLGYYRQVGFYTALLHSVLPKESLPEEGWIPFFFIAVDEETKEVEVFEPDQAAMALGYEHAMDDLRLVRDAFERAEWPGLPSTVQPIRLPEWVLRKEGLVG